MNDVTVAVMTCLQALDQDVFTKSWHKCLTCENNVTMPAGASVVRNTMSQCLFKSYLL